MTHITHLLPGQSSAENLSLLYKNAWPGCAAAPVARIAEAFDFSSKHWIVATAETRLVGAVGLLPMGQIPERREATDRFLAYARDFSSYRAGLRHYCEGIFRDTALSPVVVESFAADPKLLNRPVHENDFYFFAFATDPAYRGQGIGTRLIASACEAARSQGAPAAFAACFENSASPRIFDRLGFSSYLLLGPDAGFPETALRQVGKLF